MSSISWQNVGSEKVKFQTYFNAQFAMQSGDVADLANYMISPPAWTALFQNPSDWILRLIALPLNLFALQPSITKQNLMIGVDETTIQAADINHAFSWYNLGEYYVERKFNNFADYAGYTKIQVWLPFLGFVDVNPNDVVGKYLEISLSVDFNTGQGTYFIGVSDTHLPPLQDVPWSAGSLFENTRILSTHSLQLGFEIPLNSSNAAQVYRNIITGAVKAASVAVGAYAAGAVGAGVSASKTTTITKSGASFTRTSPKTGRKLSPGSWSREDVTSTERITDSSSYLKAKAVNEIFDYSSQALASMAIGTTSDKVNNPAILMNGSNSIQVVIYTPKLKPTDVGYEHLYGKPLGECRQLATLTGYTEIGEVHIEGTGFSTATEEEKAMIKDALLGGVFL